MIESSFKNTGTSGFSAQSISNQINEVEEMQGQMEIEIPNDTSNTEIDKLNSSNQNEKSSSDDEGESLFYEVVM